LSRTLNDDFDEDDLPSGSLDLEKGGGQVGTGAASSYSGGDGIDFDDELYGDAAGGGGALELDLPNQQQGASTSHGAAPGAPSRAPSGPMDVPDLALSAPGAQAKSSSRGMPHAPPAARSSGSLPAVRTSGMHPAAGQSSQHPAPPPPASSGRALQTMHAPDAPPSEGGHHGFAPPAPSSSRGVEDPSGPQSSLQPPPPAKPTAAAVIAKYPSPPTKVGQAPMYAVRVILRQLELRTDLESLRRRRSPDVALYEAALRAYDKKTFRLGIAINCAALAIATFIFFLPVIIRFVRAD
jgi:hypothetical protein